MKPTTPDFAHLPIDSQTPKRRAAMKSRPKRPVLEGGEISEIEARLLRAIEVHKTTLEFQLDAASEMKMFADFKATDEKVRRRATMRLVGGADVPIGGDDGAALERTKQALAAARLTEELAEQWEARARVRVTRLLAWLDETEAEDSEDDFDWVQIIAEEHQRATRASQGRPSEATADVSYITPT